jgi:hypothetical protein
MSVTMNFLSPRVRPGLSAGVVLTPRGNSIYLNVLYMETTMAIVKPLPPVEYLLECFDYDEATGYLLWKERPLSFETIDPGNLPI